MIRYALGFMTALLVSAASAPVESAEPAATTPAPLAANGSRTRPDPDAERLPDSTTFSGRLNMAPDQALYHQEYVRRRSFPASDLGLIGAVPASDLRRELRKPWPFPPLFPLPKIVSCRWMQAGPSNVPGRVTGMAVTKQPSSPGTPRVIVTSVGGVWRSMDGARTWERVSDRMKPGVFGAVAVTPGVPGEVFVGGGDPNYRDAARAGGPGIWHSSSGGDPSSWQPVGPPELDDAVIFRLQISPAGSHDVFAATSKGVYWGDRSSGTTIAWSRLKGASADAFDAPTSDIAVHFDAAGAPTLYAGTYERGTNRAAGIWKFTGSPASGQWNERSAGISTWRGLIYLALAPSSPNTIYAKVTNKTDNSLLGVYKTTSGGEVDAKCGSTVPCDKPWCNIKGPGGDDIDDSKLGALRYDAYNGAIAVHPTNPDVVFLGNRRLYGTTSGCAPWHDFSESMDPPFYNERVRIHDDQHALSFDADDPDVLWVGGDGGVYRSTKWSTTPSTGFGHWEARSHGMTTTEFWGVGTQQAGVTSLFGGMQDNGTGVTYGNRTWYARYTCDGAQAAPDAKNSVRVYQSCNGKLEVVKTVVPGAFDAWAVLPPPTSPPSGCLPSKPRSPFAVDVDMTGCVVSAGLGAGNAPCVARTIDARNWCQIKTIPSDFEVSCVAIAPPTDPGCGTPIATSFSTYYVGLRSLEGVLPARTMIVTTRDGGTSWVEAGPAEGVPLLSPNGIAVDRCDAKRAFAAYGGERGQAGRIQVTQDGGAKWDDLPFPATWLQAPALGVAIDPYDRSVIYAATAIGIYRGRVAFTTPVSCVWERFNEGLPLDATGTVSLDVTSIDVNARAGTLVLGTMGYGAYQRDIRPGHWCTATVLSIRDNVFDRGDVPPPLNEPDPEHPICANPPTCDTYKPNDGPGGRLQWWDSPDIRVDVQFTGIPPCDGERAPTEPPGPPAGVLDAVEVESCPTEVVDCDPGTMRDRNPVRGCMSRVYVQVTNRGWRPGRNLRVMALWTDATTVLPALPPTFWSTTFPAGGACQTLDESTGWHLLDQANPCKEITVLNAERPQVVYFDWKVPKSAPDHSCVLALVESSDDPIPGSTRSSLAPWAFVKNTHQIGLRNLHLVDGPSQLTQITYLEALYYRNYFPGLLGQRLVISTAQLAQRDTVAILLHSAAGLSFVGIDSTGVRLTPAEKTRALALGVDTTAVLRVRHPGGRIAGLSVPTNGSARLGVLVRTARVNRPWRAPRFTVTAMKDSIVVGGSTYVLRYEK